ncbi:hypothetical protein FDB34_02150 [Clostridium botulinum]|nr:hypothetical protein [Clostridium botulinum]
MAEIVIAILNKDGSINLDSIQNIEDWESGEKNTKILLAKSGDKLFKILKEDLNYIQLNEEGIFKFNYLSSINIEETVMRLMGNIAEAIIVSRCGESKKRNREYATIARKGKRVVNTPDKYLAIATGHYKTKKLFLSKYNPNHTQNDIIWINKKNHENELLEIGSNKIGGKTASLQIKASNLKSDYVYNEIKDNKYKVPLVYFGMKDNYFKIRKCISKDNSSINLDKKFINIQDIDKDAYKL